MQQITIDWNLIDGRLSHAADEVVTRNEHSQTAPTAKHKTTIVLFRFVA